MQLTPHKRNEVKRSVGIDSAALFGLRNLRQGLTNDNHQQYE